MQSVSDPLNRLIEEAAWFARAHEVRLLVARLSGDLRKTALQLLLGLECHADNFSPWVLLEDGHTPADDGWQARASRLAADWEKRREAFSKEGVALPVVEVVVLDPPPHGVSPGLASFLTTVAAEVGALRAPLRGLVLVVAPTVVGDPAVFEEQLGAVLGQAGLEPCRVVLVLDIDVPRPEKLLEVLGDRAVACDCTVDPDQQDRDVQALIQGGEGASPAASGAAWPRGVVPPRRVDAPPELSREQRDEALRMSGVKPEFIDQAPRLKDLVLGAALAMKQGHGPDAVRLQREARDLCHELELHEMKVICQTSLASYLSGLGQRGAAIRELEDAAQYAERHELKVQTPQAFLALGLVQALDGRFPEAAAAYSRAARTAFDAGIVVLAIEGWRLAGQIALQSGNESSGVSCLREAIRVALDAEPDAVKVSSAPEAARRLAALCRQRGLLAQSASLYDQADLMEQGALGREDFDQSVLDDDLSERVTSPYTEGSSMFRPISNEDSEEPVAFPDTPDEPEA